jgi:anaerobic magnesium-protoporphyrin IX monomethyl ester cyclase
MMALSGPPILMRIEREPEEVTGHPRHIHPALDLKYIQAAISQTLWLEAELLDGWLHTWSPSRLVDEALTRKPPIAVLKAASPCIDESLTVGKALRQAGVITVAVGQQVSHLAYQDCPGWREAFDIPVLGDPEEETPALVKRLYDGEPLAQVARPYLDALDRKEFYLVPDPDKLPQPLYTRRELKAYPFPFPMPTGRHRLWGYVLSGWGCPHRCNFCSGVVRKTSGEKLRQRSPKKVVDDIALQLDLGAQAIIFEDDTLLSNRRTFLEICNEITRRGLRFPWIAHGRADHLDEERVAAAAAAGAALFKVGVESGSQQVIERLGKTPHGETWLQRVQQAFDLLHKYRVGAVGLFLIGSPDETREDIEKSMELALRIEPDYIQVQIFCAYPDSPYYINLGTEASAQVNFGNQYHYATPTWTPSRVSPEELKELQATFYKRFYMRPKFIARHLRRYWRFYLSPRWAARSALGMAAWVAGLRDTAQKRPRESANPACSGR